MRSTISWLHTSNDHSFICVEFRVEFMWYFLIFLSPFVASSLKLYTLKPLISRRFHAKSPPQRAFRKSGGEENRTIPKREYIYILIFCVEFRVEYTRQKASARHQAEAPFYLNIPSMLFTTAA